MLKIAALTVWQWFDPLYFACTRLEYVDRSDDNVFRVRPLRYRGETLHLQDGTVIYHGDLLLKIHLHNVRLLRLLLQCSHELQKTRALYQFIERSLPGVSRYLVEHERVDDIKAVIGITQLNRACRRLGFEVHHIANPGYRWLKRCTLLPIYLLSVAQPWRSFHKHQPALLLMSKQSLLERY